MTIYIEPAAVCDVPALVDICRAASTTFGSTWDEEYPNAEILLDDVARASLFKIMLNDKVAGLLAIGETDEYNALSDPSDGERPFDFRRFGIHPNDQGKGLGILALREALDYAEAQGATCVRVLVSPGNPSALATYRKAGFEPIRTVHLWGLEHLYCRYFPRDRKENA